MGKGRQLISDVKGLFSSAESRNGIFIGTYLHGFVISPAVLGCPYVWVQKEGSQTVEKAERVKLSMLARGY